MQENGDRTPIAEHTCGTVRKSLLQNCLQRDFLGFQNCCILLKRLVGERGFEPPTPWSRTRCSTRLSHSPTWKRLRQQRSAGASILWLMQMSKRQSLIITELPPPSRALAKSSRCWIRRAESGTQLTPHL